MKLYINSVLKFNGPKSYSLTVAPKVCLIYDNNKNLIRIKDVLGGLYTLKPISVSKIFSANFFSVKDFDISGKFPNFEINFNWFDSIDFEKCTYCGECYKACPEKCINENLEIDLNICTFCGECEKVCKEKAIDIDRVVSDKFNASFILTDLEDLLTRNINGVLEISDIDKMLSMTGEFLVEENILHDQNLCQYSGKLDFGCKRCLEECKYNALGIDNNSIVIDYFACESCGKCVAVCPTGAMQYIIDDKSFVSFFKDKFVKDKIIVAGNEEEIRKFKWKNTNNLDDILFLEIDPKFYNLMHYLFLFSIGASNLIVLNDKLIESLQISFANRLLEYLFKIKNFIKFSFDHKDTCINPLEVTYNNFNFENRRKKLSSILKFLFENSNVKDVLIDENYLNIFGEVVVDEDNCSLCLACVNHCKIGALLSNELNYSLNHNPSICIQCKICEYVCPEDSISIKSGLLLNEKFFSVNELCKDEELRCPGCNKVFGSKKIFETVKLKLLESNLFDSKGKFLHYCDECRVRRLFES